MGGRGCAPWAPTRAALPARRRRVNDCDMGIGVDASPPPPACPPRPHHSDAHGSSVSVTTPPLPPPPPPPPCGPNAANAARAALRKAASPTNSVASSRPSRSVSKAAKAASSGGASTERPAEVSKDATVARSTEPPLAVAACAVARPSRNAWSAPNSARSTRPSRSPSCRRTSWAHACNENVRPPSARAACTSAGVTAPVPDALTARKTASRSDMRKRGRG